MSLKPNSRAALDPRLIRLLDHRAVNHKRDYFAADFPDLQGQLLIGVVFKVVDADRVQAGGKGQRRGSRGRRVRAVEVDPHFPMREQARAVVRAKGEIIQAGFRNREKTARTLAELILVLLFVIT